jgi:monoamine oxidase
MQTVDQAHWVNLNPDKEQLFHEVREAGHVSRREFLRLLAAAGFATAAGELIEYPLQAREARRTLGKPFGGHVAILGAGIAGLTAAYRLQKAGVPCEIFEASTRTGGRMFSKRNFNAEGMFCELGGELVDSNHEDLIKLAGELGVEIQELKGRDQGVDMYFFDGKRYTDDQLIPAFKPFASKLATDKGALYQWGNFLPEKAAHFDRISLAEYLAEAGKGVDKWVVDMLRVAYVIEYGRDADEQSALNLINYLDPETKDGFKVFGDSDESKRIKGGSSTLPEAVAEAIAGRVKIHHGFRLVNIGSGNGMVALTFATDGGAKTLKYERVVCALPFTILRLVDGVDRLPISVAKKRSIAHLGYGNNVKLMLGFTERWWRNPAAGLPALSNGSIFTDVPLQCTWETSRGQDGSSGILTNYMGGSNGKRFTPARIDNVKEELDRIFPGIKERFDGKRAVMNWPVYQYTRGSYTCPLVGQCTTLLEATRTPELGGRLIFAGEHTSADFSGFMNGAIQSGNRAAHEIMEPARMKVPKAA